MTLLEAKKQSLMRWKRILADYPDVKLDTSYQPDRRVYGVCGFCMYTLGQDCEYVCPLYPNICTPTET